MAKTKPEGGAGPKPQPAWACSKMRFPDVLTAPGRLLDRYPVLAALPGADDVPDALLRYVLLRCGQHSPFHQLINLPTRLAEILKAVDADEETIRAIHDPAEYAGKVLPLCIAYLRKLDPLGLLLSELLAAEDSYWQDVAGVAAEIDGGGGGSVAVLGAGLKDDAVLKARVTRTQLRKELAISRRDLMALRNEIFNTDHELRDAALAEDGDEGGYVEAHTRGESFVPTQ